MIILFLSNGIHCECILLSYFNRITEDTIMVYRYSSKESLHNEWQVDSKVSSRLEIMHKKEMKKERKRGEKEICAATKLFQKDNTLSHKKLKKALHHIERERIRWLSHQEELMMKLYNSKFRIKV